MLRGSQNGKRCSKGTELLKGAEAALSFVTHGKLDKCNIQAVSGRTGHALWQIAPSSSLLAPPATPPREGALGTISEEALLVAVTRSQIYPNSGIVRRSDGLSLSLSVQKGPLGPSSQCCF